MAAVLVLPSLQPNARTSAPVPMSPPRRSDSQSDDMPSKTRPTPASRPAIRLGSQAQMEPGAGPNTETSMWLASLLMKLPSVPCLHTHGHHARPIGTRDNGGSSGGGGGGGGGDTPPSPWACGGGAGASRKTPSLRNEPAALLGGECHLLLLMCRACRWMDGGAMSFCSDGSVGAFGICISRVRAECRERERERGREEVKKTLILPVDQQITERLAGWLAERLNTPPHELGTAGCPIRATGEPKFASLGSEEEKNEPANGTGRLVVTGGW
ncbi:hypothetical protein IWZ03DRAFT_406610 [Phyllosticta citriasiana]|uniref:Uncharacterized protein n=1 Tax=Phyllosticta citriasiana TaxID=595635 RepID=A0ABR1KM04_9PEZI